MKPFMFEHSLSKQDLGDMYEHQFIETMEDISRQLQLTRKQESEHFPSYVDVKVVVVNAREFMTDGRASEDLTALRVYLESSGVFEEINDMHTAQGAPDVLVDEAGRTRIATSLLNNGSHVVATQDDTMFLLLIRPDHIPTAHHYMATLAGLDQKDIPRTLLDLESLQNLHVMRLAGDKAYDVAMTWLEQVGEERLLQLWPEGEEREERKERIGALKSTTASGINRAARFEQLVDACTHAKGSAAVQQYIDALMFHALAHGGEMDMITGKLLNTPNDALRKLRQAFALHQHHLQDADQDMAHVAMLISDIGEENRSEALDLFGLPLELLDNMGITQDFAKVLNGIDASYADRPEVREYVAVLNEGDSAGTLADIEKVVPFLFEQLEQQAPDMDEHTKLRVALSRVLSVTAGAEHHVLIDACAQDLPEVTMINVQRYALTQHYLEIAQRLMPERFPALAPVRRQEADERLTNFKRLMNAERPSSGPGAMHS